MTRAALSFAAPLSVNGQLFLYSGKQFFTNQRRDGNRHLIGCAGVVGRVRSARSLALPALRLEPRATFADARLAKRGTAHISWVFQHSPHAGAIPPGLARGARRALLLQPPSYLANRQPVAADPIEDLSHDCRLRRNDFIRGQSATGMLRDVAITVRCAAQHVYQAALCGVPLAAAAALQNLRAFVFGKHTLHLQEQIFLGRHAQARLRNTISTPYRRSSSTNNTWYA